MTKNWGSQILTSNNIQGQPFVAQYEQVSSEVLLDGRVEQQTLAGIVYRDTDGRTRKELSLQVAAGVTAHIAFIHDPIKESMYVLDMDAKTVIEERFSAVISKTAASMQLTTLPESIAIDPNENLGQQEIEGLICHIHHMHDADAEIEVWYSDELKEVLLEKRTGKLGQSMLRLYNIRRVEPEDKLFTVPADYTTATQSQMNAAYLSEAIAEEGNDGIYLNDVAASGNIAIVQSLLTVGVDVNAKGYRDETALMAASEYGHRTLVEILLDAGADANARSKTGATALIHAALNGHMDVIQTLLAAGAEIDTKEDRQTALMFAAVDGREDVVNLLIAAGADVNAKESHRMTALIWAAARGYTKIVQALIVAGADVNIKNNDGYTALELAKLEEQAEIVEILEKAGAVE